MKASPINNFYTERQGQIIALLGSAVVLLVVMYAVFLFLAVQSAMLQKSAYRESQALGKELVALESSYGVLKDSITIEKATELGLVPISSARFASRDEAIRLTLDLR